MLRSDVLQSLLDLFRDPHYLEIGVNKGETFRAVRAHKKVAVDPAFLFDTSEAAKEDESATYHEVTSDQFFESLPKSTKDFDVIYLDGLHTFEQTLRDLLNTLSFSHDNSVVVIDDVVPTSFAASLPRLDDVFKLRALTHDSDMSWMGDVFRLVYFVQTFLPMYSYATLTDNHGQLVMWRSARMPVERTVFDISQTSYLDTILDNSPYRFNSFSNIISDIRRTISS